MFSKFSLEVSSNIFYETTEEPRHISEHKCSRVRKMCGYLGAIRIVPSLSITRLGVHGSFEVRCKRRF
jgi:hypothetical protein